MSSSEGLYYSVENVRGALSCFMRVFLSGRTCGVLSGLVVP